HRSRPGAFAARDAGDAADEEDRDRRARARRRRRVGRRLGDVSERPVEDLLRELAPQVLGALVRRHGQFDLCEDAVQEALLAATVQWPRDGVPDRPRGWLVTVAERRLVDRVRSESASRRREEAEAAALPADAAFAPSADEDAAAGDDTLTLLFLCCHPALSPASQV